MTEHGKPQVPNWAYLALGSIVAFTSLFMVIETLLALAHGQEDLMLRNLAITAFIIVFIGLPTGYAIQRKIND